jgi:putative transposase
MPHLSVRKLCRSLGVNRQWYYQHRCRSAHQESDQRLRAAIHEIREIEAGYGYRRVTKALVRAGWKVNHKRVWRVMRQAGLTCRRKRRTVHTTDSKHSYQIYPNLVKGLQVEAPNRLTGRRSDLCAIARRQRQISSGLIHHVFPGKTIV